MILGPFLILAGVLLGSKNEPISSVLGVVGIGVFLSGWVASRRMRKMEVFRSADAANNTPPPIPPVGTDPATPPPRPHP